MPDEEKVNDENVNAPVTREPQTPPVPVDPTPANPESPAQPVDFTASEPTTPPLHPELAITKPPKEKKSRRPLILIAVLVLLVAGGAAAYFYMNKDETPVQSATTQTPPPTPAGETETKSPSPNTAAYAFKPKESDPYQLFWRPAGGGDKTAATSLNAGELIPYSDVYKNMVAVATISAKSDSFKIWLSQDGGKSYKSAYTSPAGNNQITSLKFAADGSAVAFGELNQLSKNTVKSLDIATLKTQDLFTGEKAGVFVHAYSPSAKQVVYSEGCFNCDGSSGDAIKLYDLAAKSASDLVVAAADKSVTFQAVNGNFSEILVKNANMPTDSTDALSSAMNPPYDLTSVTIKDKTKTTLGTFGEKPKATDAAPFGAAGYMNDGTTPYFAYKNQIFKVSAGKKTLVYESSKDLVGVYYVSQDTVVTSSGTYNDFLMSSFTIKDQKSTTILNGDANTSIFGVTIN